MWDVGVDHAQALESLDLAFVNEFRCRLCLPKGTEIRRETETTDAGSCRRPPEASPFLTHQLDFNHIHKCVYIPVHTYTYSCAYIHMCLYSHVPSALSIVFFPLTSPSYSRVLTSFTKCLYKETCKLVQVPGWLHWAKRMLTLCSQAH